MEGSFYHNTQPVSKNYYKKLYNSETFHNKRSILIWKSGDQLCSRKIKSGCGYFFLMALPKSELLLSTQLCMMIKAQTVMHKNKTAISSTI